MDQHYPTITFEDIPLEQARAMSRGPRIDPELYNAPKANIQSLGNTATRITLADGTRPDTMKNRLLRVAAELGVPVTIRNVPEGLLFWRATDEDLMQAQQHASRLQHARRGRG